jgi:HEAT repeat protein
MDYAEIDRLIASDDSSDRRSAAYALGEAGGDPAVERLVVLLEDLNSGVRDAAYNTLMFMGGRSAVEKVAPLLAETDPGVRNAAIDILRAIGDDAIDVLHAMAREVNDDIRLFVFDILGTIKNPSSVEVLIEGLKDPNPNVRNAAVVSLGMIADESAFEPLTRLIDDEEWIRFSVIEALSHLNHDGLPSFIMGQIERFVNDELTMSALLDAAGATRCEGIVHRLGTLLGEVPRSMEADVVGAILRILPHEKIRSLPGEHVRLVKSAIERNVGSAQGEFLSLMLGALSVIGDSESVRVLVDLARILDPDASAEVFDSVEDTLVAIGDVDTAGGLLGGEEKISVLGARVLARIKGERSALLVRRHIPSSRGHVKRVLVDALAAIDAKGNSSVFRGLLSDMDGHVLRSSIQALGRCGDPEDIERITPFLGHAYPDVRDAALDAIVTIGTHGAEDVFLSMSSSAEPALRMAAIEGLSRMSSARLSRVARDFLADPATDVRLLAAAVIRDKGVPISVEELQGLLSDGSWDIRCTALDVIGKRRMEELREVLEQGVREEDLRLASHALEALASFADERAMATLVEVLRSGSDFLRISAARALGDSGRGDLAPAIEPFVEDPNPDVARAALDALDKLQGVNF